MRKKILFLSIVCLLFITLSYTYSSFKSSIVGNINGNIKDWVFKVSVNNGTIENGGYKLHLGGTSGSFNVNINTVGGIKDADYTIELIGDNSIKYYTDSSYSTLITNNIYSGSINSNTNSSIIIYYKSDTSLDSDIIIKIKGNIMEVAMMKNGYSSNITSENGGTEFWNRNYKPYIKTVKFSNDLSNMPSSCTEKNLCWDISYDANQKKKVYGYLINTGEKDADDSTKALYNLYIVSESQIFAPSDCNNIFSFFAVESSNLVSIDFNNNFNTSNVTDMNNMFYYCSSLKTLDLSNFNTSKVTNMYGMFGDCSSLTSLNLSNFNTSNVTAMNWMFSFCSSLKTLNLSNFNTSNVEDMSAMFESCHSLTTLDLSNFNTSNVINMEQMFSSCVLLKTLDLSKFNTSKVTNMGYMFCNCSSLITTINIMSSNVTNYNNMFKNAATSSNAKITVNYVASASTLVDKMIATKTSNNVVKGSQI